MTLFTTRVIGITLEGVLLIASGLAEPIAKAEMTQFYEWAIVFVEVTTVWLILLSEMQRMVDLVDLTINRKADFLTLSFRMAITLSEL